MPCLAKSGEEDILRVCEVVNGFEEAIGLSIEGLRNLGLLDGLENVSNIVGGNDEGETRIEALMSLLSSLQDIEDDK